MKPGILPGTKLTALVIYAGLLIALGAGRLWKAPLSVDESTFYDPAIQYFAQHFSPAVVADYPFPGPPLGLIQQSLLYKCGVTWAGIRALSTFYALVTFLIVLAWIAPSDFTWAHALAMVSVFTFPYFAEYSFLLKHHTMTAAAIMGAWAAWKRYRATGSSRLLFASAACSLAGAMTSQLALPMAGLLVLEAFEVWRKSKNKTKASIPVLLMMVPVVAVGALFLLWGGPQPLSYRLLPRLVDSQVMSLTFRPGQVVLALITFGVWIFPRSRVGWKEAVAAACLVPLLALMAHRSGMYRSGLEWFDQAAGIVTTLMRFLFPRSYFMLIVGAALVAAAGACALLSVRSLAQSSDILRYTALYACMMNFVPYHFESYYLLLFIPVASMSLSSWWKDSQSLRHRVLNMGFAMAGLVYVMVKR